MRNHVFITFDSLRWDIFKKAKAPYIKGLGDWKKAWTPAAYTFPAHMSFFVGKIPQTFDQTDFYDSTAVRVKNGRTLRKKQLLRLSNPESPRPSSYDLEGKNIVEGFKKKGFLTVGTGAMNWFNPELPAGEYLSGPFEEYRFFSGPGAASHESAEEQLEWAESIIGKSERPVFLFINFGETHHRFLHKGCDWRDDSNPYGNARECKRRQRLCFEYLDRQLKNLDFFLKDANLVLCADHGEAMGESGLWGHGFVHPRVMEVPLLIRNLEGEE